MKESISKELYGVLQILCIQEVQADHYTGFLLPKLQELGYYGVFKKRTNDKVDGCSIFFKYSIFEFLDYNCVEFYEPCIPILNRDNIGIVVKLRSRHMRHHIFCVATTHLLYNPHRHDVKLVQLQILLAELDKMAHSHKYHNRDYYYPVILAGDFNLEPDSSIHQFLLNGELTYSNLESRCLTPDLYGHGMGNELLPKYFGITDQCQYQRIIDERKSKTPVSFGSGTLSHHFYFKSVYPYKGLNRCVTTHHNQWVNVDYIFYSNAWSRRYKKIVENGLKLLSRYRLPTVNESASLQHLPTIYHPSDHFPLVARFLFVD